MTAGLRACFRYASANPAASLTTCSLRTTRGSAGLDCRILAMRKYAGWLALPADL